MTNIFETAHKRWRNRGLTNREAEVAELVARGMTNKEVAKQLFVTEKTIKFHLTNIYKACKLKSRAQLIVLSIREIEIVPPKLQGLEPKTAVIDEARELPLGVC